MKDSRRSSFKYTENLFLHVVKYDLLFFLYGFSYANAIIHITAGEGGGYLLILFLPLPPALQTLRH